MSGIDGISVADDRGATIRAGARLGQVYAALHAYGLTLPAGCGPTVGITGLTLGGGIGLLGRKHGLTCDRLVGAQVVLPNGSVVDCDLDHEPDLFWALRGAGGGQFGVVTSMRFDTVPEPMTTRIEAHWSDIALEELVTAWQAWASDAPDELTVNLTVESELGGPVQATLFGASTLLRDLPERALRIRSEFFSHAMSDRALASLLTQLGDQRTRGRRQLTFTAMGGAYNRVAEDATAFAHRSERSAEHARAFSGLVRCSRRGLVGLAQGTSRGNEVIGEDRLPCLPIRRVRRTPSVNPDLFRHARVRQIL